jgi:tRNA-Thr(GGU) m(6)t(6)A37 methyltransferase TsaA
MQLSSFNYKAIGVVHSTFKEPKNVPIQAASKDTEGTLEIYPEYVEGLQDVEGFSHLILLYHFHLIEGCSFLVKPFLDDNLHGVFATRSPARPNKIGLSVVRLIDIKNNILHIQNVDIIDGTPLLDIKPFVPEFDCRNTNKIGWLGDKIDKLDVTKDDGRFWK